MVNKVEFDESVPAKSKLSYGLGNFANTVLNSLVFANLTYFYNIKLNMDGALLGIGWLIFAIWNTVNDPMASYIIDNTRTKIGRRIPYIRYGSFLYGLAFIYSWIPIFPLDNEIGLFINFLIALFLLDTMFTFVGACFFSLPNEIAITAKERASLGIYTALFGFINIIVGLVFPIFLLVEPVGIPSYFYPTVILIGTLCTAILFITSYFYKENMFAQLQPREGFIEGLRLTLKNKPFWIYMIPAFCIYLVYPILQTALLYYLNYVIAGQNILFGVIVFVIGIVIGFILTFKKMKNWKPKKTMIINLSLITCATFFIFFLGFNALLAAIAFLLLGVGLSGSFVIMPVIMGDTIDNDELITGKRREAIYGGVNALINKPAISLANWMFLSIIGVFGFIENSPLQSDLALFGILFAFGFVPGLFLLLGAITMKWYPLDGKEWENKKEKIIELHKQKENEYISSLKLQQS